MLVNELTLLEQKFLFLAFRSSVFIVQVLQLLFIHVLFKLCSFRVVLRRKHLVLIFLSKLAQFELHLFVLYIQLLFLLGLLFQLFFHLLVLLLQYFQVFFNFLDPQFLFMELSLVLIGFRSLFLDIILK